MKITFASLALALLCLFYPCSSAQAAGTVTGTKYSDSNGNNQIDVGIDLPVQGVVIFLDANNSGTLDPGEPSTVTGPDGTYTLGGLPAGPTLRICEQLTAPVVIIDRGGGVGTLPGSGPAASRAWIPVLPAGGCFDLILAEGETFVLNFLNRLPSDTFRIRGNKYRDDNQNGQADAGEPTLPGVVIFLDTNGNGVVDGGESSTVTDANGFYSFLVGPGTYRVCEVLPAGYQVVAPANGCHDNVIISSGGATLHFFNALATYGISGVKYHDTNRNGQRDLGEPGLQGWTIYLDLNTNNTLDLGEPSQVTNAVGAYAFNNLAGGQYTVREVNQAGWVQSEPAAGAGHLIGLPPSAVDVNFGNHPDGPPDNALARLAGCKFHDANENGIKEDCEPCLPGWLIFLDSNGNGTFQFGEPTTTTDARGEYAFSVNAGTYTVRESANPAMPQTFPAGGAGHVVTVAPGQSRGGLDFGNSGTLRKVTGVKFDDIQANNVRDPGDPGIAGWLIYADTNFNNTFDYPEEPATVTNENGEYTLILPPGSYEIKEASRPGWTQSYPLSSSYLVDLTIITEANGFDFGNFRDAFTVFGSFQGAKFFDANADGTFQPGEPGLARWMIYVDLDASGDYTPGTDPVTLTRDRGYYSFELPAAFYTVREYEPPHWARTTPPAGLHYVSASGPASGTFDFGNRSLLGDSDRDGFDDAAEALWGTSAADPAEFPRAMFQRVSSLSGKISFPGLPCRAYVIWISLDLGLTDPWVAFHTAAGPAFPGPLSVTFPLPGGPQAYFLVEPVEIRP